MDLPSPVTMRTTRLLASAQGHPQPPGERLCRRLCRRLCAAVCWWWALTMSPRAQNVPGSRRSSWKVVLVVLGMVEVMWDWTVGLNADVMLVDLVCPCSCAVLLGRVVLAYWRSDIIMVTAFVMPCVYAWQFQPPAPTSTLACANFSAYLTVSLGLFGVRSVVIGAASLFLGVYLYSCEPDVNFRFKHRCLGQMFLSNIIIALAGYLIAELSERSRRETLAKERLLDASTGGSFTLDFDGCICDASEGLVSTFGGSNLQGRALADFIVGREDQARVGDLVRSLGEVKALAFAASDENLGDPFVVTFRVLRSSGAPGEQAEFDARLTPYQTSGVSLCACIHILGEVRPYHAESAVTAAPDRSNDVSIEFNIFDPAQMVTKVSARWQEMFGPVAERACFADVLPGGDGERLMRKLQGAVNSDFTQRGYQRRHTVTVRLTDVTLQDTGGRKLDLTACAVLPPFAVDFLPGRPFIVTLSLWRLPGGQAAEPTIPLLPSKVLSISSTSSSSSSSSSSGTFPPAWRRAQGRRAAGKLRPLRPTAAHPATPQPWPRCLAASAVPAALRASDAGLERPARPRQTTT